MTTYIDDTFTGTLNTNCDSHAPDTGPGGNWATSVSAANKLNGAGNAYRNVTTTTRAFVLPVSVNDYSVKQFIDAKTLLASDRMNSVARFVDDNNTYLCELTQAGVINLYKIVAAATTQIGGPVSITLTGGTTPTMEFILQGTSLRVLWNDVEQINITDSTFASGGKAGFRVGASSTTQQTTTTGLQLNRILVADPPTPQNTVAPVVTGTRVVGQTLSTSDGTWSNSPTSFAYQWTRDGTNIGGATANTYVAVSGDVGHAIACKVTASNALGAGPPATSNSLTIVAEMVAADIQFWLAAGGGLGGSPSAAIPAPTAVFDAVSFSEALNGDAEYRAVYLKNTHAVRSLSSTVAWIATQTTSLTTDIAIGVAPEAAGSDVTTIADEQTPPVSVSFSAPASEGTGLSIGTLGPGQARGLWLRRTVAPSTAELASDSATLAWSGTPS